MVTRRPLNPQNFRTPHTPPAHVYRLWELRNAHGAPMARCTVVEAAQSSLRDTGPAQAAISGPPSCYALACKILLARMWADGARFSALPRDWSVVDLGLVPSPKEPCPVTVVNSAITSPGFSISASPCAKPRTPKPSLPSQPFRALLFIAASCIGWAMIAGSALDLTHAPEWLADLVVVFSTILGFLAVNFAIKRWITR